MNLPLGSEPIRTLLIPVALGAFVAAAQAFIAGADTRAIITAVLGALVVAAQELGRKLVTPVPVETESGYSLVEALVACFIAALILLVVLAILGRV